MTQAARAYSTTAPNFGSLPLKAAKAVKRLRREAAAEIERLMALLDATEPDADLEPSLGSLAANEWDKQTRWAGGGIADIEIDEAYFEGDGTEDEGDELDGRESCETELSEGSEEEFGEADGFRENVVDQDAADAQHDHAVAQEQAAISLAGDRRRALARRTAGSMSHA
jgi:hypothetical protein